MLIKIQVTLDDIENEDAVNEFWVALERFEYHAIYHLKEITDGNRVTITEKNDELICIGDNQYRYYRYDKDKGWELCDTCMQCGVRVPGVYDNEMDAMCKECKQ